MTLFSRRPYFLALENEPLLIVLALHAITFRTLRYVLFRFVPLPSLPFRYVHHITLGLDQTTNFS